MWTSSQLQVIEAGPVISGPTTLYIGLEGECYSLEGELYVPFELGATRTIDVATLQIQ